MASNDLPPIASLTLTQAFKLVFLTVLGLSVLSLAISVYIAVLEKPSDLAKTLFETCSTTYKMGFGAIIGLIGGKALS